MKMSMRKMPDYREEVVKPYDGRTAMEEASRCLLCHDAPCSKACPAGTDPGSFIMSLRFRNDKGAAETIRKNNPLGGICARVCPYDRLCEEACSRCGIDKPIEIGRLQRYAADQEAVFGMKVMEKAEPNGKKVACIGSGPASLACAAMLAQEGVSVTVYEKKPKAGGLLTYGIIPSRLPQDIVDQEIARVTELGVELRCGCEVGKDISFEELQKEYDAVFVGTGLGGSKKLGIPGEELDGVVDALDFLAEARVDGKTLEAGERVLVIGGGDVAMDAASTAALQGARVTVVYRRTLAEAPANTKEVEFTQSLGVGFLFQTRPEEILGENGKVKGLKAVGVDHASSCQLAADKVILAIGQSAEPIPVPALAVNEKQLIPAENGKTNLAGVFAGGDIVNGGKTVVQAVAEGKTAAEEILTYLAVKSNNGR